MPGNIIKVALSVVVFLTTVLVTTCVRPYGSVGKGSVEEVMRADAIAVTPCLPGWLLESDQIQRLSDGEFRELNAILRRSNLREVHESHYREEVAAGHVFYLYASTGQCLGAKVGEEQVLLDDFDLTEEDSRALYRMLRPHLEKVLEDF
ncbi:MAG: hypothetical protein E7031_06815 [Akkermansiaceae bacterium]|nr:hypothetical protein [Akkermansiaceae bacterium]